METQDPSPDGLGAGNAREVDVGRRRLLLAGFWTSAAAAGLTLTGVGGRFIVGESLEAPPAQWVKVGETAALTAGRMHRATYTVRRKDAWRTTEQKGLLYVYSEDGATYNVLSAICTHLGCNVHWREETRYFRCPCHDGYFNRDGSIISGPAQEPLVVLQTKVEEGVLFALV